VRLLVGKHLKLVWRSCFGCF